MHHDHAGVRQNDPAELLEVYNVDGRPTGIAKPRAAVHLDGDWHRAFHCWILRHGDSEVVLQRRSEHKDTYAGCWDAAAAGHWRFGESASEAAREIDEELGISVSFGDLTYVGREQSERKHANGLTDLEFHEVYVLRDDRPLTAYRPDPKEVSALASFSLGDLIAVVAGSATTLTSLEAVSVNGDGQLAPTRLTVRSEELVPYSASRLRRNLGRPDSVDKIDHG